MPTAAFRRICSYCNFDLYLIMLLNLGKLVNLCTTYSAVNLYSFLYLCECHNHIFDSVRLYKRLLFYVFLDYSSIVTSVV